MTKISNITEKPHVPQQKPVEKSQSDLFKRALDEASQGGKPTETAVAPQATTGSLGEIRATAMPQRVESGASDVANRTDKLLNLLDNYSQDLGNPEKSLKEIEPLLTDIRNSAQRLLEDAGSSGQADPKLNRIATETAMFANTEYIKFNRGDYI